MDYGSTLRNLYLEEALELRRQGYSHDKIAKIFSLGHDTVRRWCVKFAPELLDSVNMKKNPTTPKPMQEKKANSDTKELEKRIKELEAKLKKESLRAAFYDEMINVAEAKFNITIRKKAGTKR